MILGRRVGGLAQESPEDMDLSKRYDFKSRWDQRDVRSEEAVLITSTIWMKYHNYPGDSTSKISMAERSFLLMMERI
jgi:hypothetical protein